MNKFLNKWFRRFHRWLVLPFIAILLTGLLFNGTSLGNMAMSIQKPLVIILAITGLYLWCLPYLIKWQRQRTRTN